LEADFLKVLEGVLEVFEALLLGLPLAEAGVGGLPFEVDGEFVFDLLDGFEGADEVTEVEGPVAVFVGAEFELGQGRDLAAGQDAGFAGGFSDGLIQ